MTLTRRESSHRSFSRCLAVAALALVLGCESPPPAQRPVSRFSPPSALQQAAKRILNSEVFPELNAREKVTIEREVAYIKNAPRYESESGGTSGATSRYRVSCAILAEMGRKAVPDLLKSLNDDLPIGNLYIALALEEIDPRIAKGVWAAIEQDSRGIPCLDGRDFRTIPLGEIARLRGRMPGAR